MSHTTLKRFVFPFNPFCNLPGIAIRIYGFDSNGNKLLSPLFWGILDSGSGFFTIPKKLADSLNLKYKLMKEKAGTAGGSVTQYQCKGDFVISDNNNLVTFTNEKIAILDSDTPILVGIDPVFNAYRNVVICAQPKLSILNP